MHKLIDYICDELDELEKKADKGKLSMSEVEYADKLAHLKKNLLRSEELMDEGFSGDTGAYNRMYGNNGGSSYARNRRRDSMGRYSSDGGRYPMYARDDGFMSELHELKNSAPNEQVRREVEQMIDRIQNKL